MTKAVVLFSGGIDSTTCLAEAIVWYGKENVVALTMFYGQKHDKELESAKAVAEYYGVKHIVKDMSAVFEFDPSPLVGKDKEIPNAPYGDAAEKKEDGLSKTYVAFRNGLFLSAAASIAYSLGAEVVYYGAHADDAAGSAYPDCTTDFYEAMNTAIREGTGYKVRLVAPLVNWTKAQIVHRGLELKAPYHLTWSCYEGSQYACGGCATCLDRLKAFEANGATDPIRYNMASMLLKAASRKMEGKLNG